MKNKLCAFPRLPPPSCWCFSHQATLGPGVPWAELMEGPGNLPQPWWEPSAGARAAVEAEFGGAEEGGEEEEGVCVHVGVESVCRKQPSGSLPCEILIIPASAISAMRSGPPLLNISLTPLTSHCTSPTFLSPIDPSPIAAPRPCHQQQPWPGASLLHPHPGHARGEPSPAPATVPRAGEGAEAVLRKEDHQLHWEQNISVHQQVPC